MFQKYAIFIAVVLGLLAGTASAETTRQTDSSDAPLLNDRDLQPIPTSANISWLDEYTFAPDEQTPQLTDKANPATSYTKSSDAYSLITGIEETSLITGIEETPDIWQDFQIANVGELPASDSTVGAVAYFSSKYSFYRHSKSLANRGPLHGLALRGGWWDIQTDGSKTKIGEYQSLESSEFWDADGLYTDGNKTIDFSVTGLDSEATDAGLRYYGPRLTADVEYQRFLRRLDHDPLAGMADVQQQPPGGIIVTKEDLNVGEDYAIRVQELKANFKGDLTKNLKWRLGIWGMRKHGERQVNAMGHCFNHPNGEDTNGNPVFGTSCHVLTQQQRIDWVTTEIEPALEATLGPATFEYARTMRAFDQSDQVTTRPFDSFGFSGDLPYAVVPENFTEIDRVKTNMRLLRNWDVYSLYYDGNTKNRSRDTNRRLWGLDVRTTVRPSSGSSLTGFAKKNVQTGQIPAVLLPEENIANIRAPIDYDQAIAGIKGRWRPFYGDRSWRRGVRLSGGYQYRGLSRGNAIFSEDSVTVDQSQTTANLAHVRASMKWNSAIESNVRYRVGFVDDPLFGIAKNGETNTGLPTEEHLVEIGGTWTPADNFLLTGTFGLENRWNTSQVSNFEEDNYPTVITAWYAPAPHWTFSGGLAFFSNWIDQDITLGGLSDTNTSRWNYRGRSEVVNAGTTYAWSECLTFSGGFEYVRGSNGFATPASTPDLSQFSDVLVETTRWTAGFDYQIRSGADFYFRYQLFDYEDKSQDFTQDINSGTANMFMTGINATF